MNHLIRSSVVGLIGLVAMAFVSGCASPSMERLQKVLTHYNRCLQEGDAESAAQFVDPMRRAAFLAEMNGQTGSKEIQDFAIRPFTLKSDAKQTKVKILRNVIDKRSYEAREMTIEQEWVFRDKTWMLLGGEF